MRYQKGNVFIWVLIIGALLLFFGENESNEYKNSSGFLGPETIDRYEAMDYYWDEIREYMTGTETIEACSSQSGNCYDLDADIYDGIIDQIYFPNGGYLYFGAYIDSNGYASEYDQNGNAWDFYVDLDSSYLAEDALYEWASDNGYELD